MFTVLPVQKMVQLVVRTEIGWLDDEGLVMHSNHVAGKVLLHFIIFHKDCAADKR